MRFGALDPFIFGVGAVMDSILSKAGASLFLRLGNGFFAELPTFDELEQISIGAVIGTDCWRPCFLPLFCILNYKPAEPLIFVHH